MSPLHIDEYRSGGRIERDLYIVPPGEAVTYLGQGEYRYLIFECNTDDRGVKIYGAHNHDDFNTVQNQLIIPEDKKDNIQVVAEIEMGAEINIGVKPKGLLGKLVVRHVITNDSYQSKY